MEFHGHPGGWYVAAEAEPTRAGTIDEPEMYLHPQAQRHFHEILLDLVETGGTQVVYSTHSPVFADATHYASLRLMRRKPGKSSAVTYVGDPKRQALDTEKNAIKLLTEYDTARSEALFADAVLLVEGKADRIGARGVAKQMTIDLDARNLTVIECGGKSSIPFHALLCRALGVPVCALYDDDQWPDDPSASDDDRTKRWKRNESERAVNERIEQAIPDAAARFVCSPTLEQLVGIGRESSNKPLQMAPIVSAAPNPAALPESLVRAVQRLASEAASE